MRARLIPLILPFFAYFTLVSFVNGQSNRHWGRSFNEESSLLSGAVVGGGVGPSAIFYNPSAIVDVDNSSLSLHASLFSVELYSLRDLLGKGIDLSSSRIQIQPRFISYLIHPKKNNNFSIELAYLNNEIYNTEFSKSVDKEIDILKSLPGDERYFAMFNYNQEYRDDWIGIGTSWRINNSLFLGASMFVQIKSATYYYSIGIEAFPISDTVSTSSGEVPFYSANYQEFENYHFNNYRLIWKLGVMYKWDNVSLGITLRTPSVGLYSDGKRVSHQEKQANITNPLTGNFLPNYVVVDYKEKQDVKANMKDPFSIAAGVTINLPDGKKTIFTTVEYFNGLSTYPMLSAETSVSAYNAPDFNPAVLNNWLTYGYGAKPVFNAAVGYRSEMKENLMLFAGFRTDFNYMKGVPEGDDSGYQFSKNLDLNVYHLTGGVNLTIFGQDLIAGFQYSFGYENNVKQLINLYDPVEYNFVERKPLQGNRQEDASILYNSISLYFGATLNFIKEKEPPK
jgi:hypothetical protein